MRLTLTLALLVALAAFASAASARQGEEEPTAEEPTADEPTADEPTTETEVGSTGESAGALADVNQAVKDAGNDLRDFEAAVQKDEYNADMAEVQLLKGGGAAALQNAENALRAENAEVQVAEKILAKDGAEAEGAIKELGNSADEKKAQALLSGAAADVGKFEKAWDDAQQEAQFIGEEVVELGGKGGQSDVEDLIDATSEDLEIFKYTLEKDAEAAMGLVQEFEKGSD